ncbi:MAG: hypothetical protein NTX96_00885 [Candidatus Zambryskibacteria bacterium]|nr:hypothetical protein [Candidatus Zambryskibacteria bacterium]
MKKTIFTLNFDNYAPEITAITYPFIERYAKKIGAEFKIITKRVFPEYPLTYEKFQIYELGADNDWNYYIDSDCLVHPDFFDITEVLPEDTVLSFNADFAGGRFHYDEYFKRDGRNIGGNNFFTVASYLTREIWEPLKDITLEEALKNIKIIENDKLGWRSDGWEIDDYVISRNIAKYGFKFKTFISLLNEIGRLGEEYIYHEVIPREDKIKKINERLQFWKYL